MIIIGKHFRCDSTILEWTSSMDEPKELPSLCSNLARLTQPHTDLFEGVVPLLEVRGVRGELLVVCESPREGVPLALRLRQPDLQLVHAVTLLVQGGLQREGNLWL